MFKSAFIHSIHLLVEGPLSMVFEHLQNIFKIDSGFSYLFLACSFVVTWCIFRNIAKAFAVVKLLALAKPFGGIRPIIIGEVFNQLVNRTFCL
jgi:hypothetical protein